MISIKDAIHMAWAHYSLPSEIAFTTGMQASRESASISNPVKICDSTRLWVYAETEARNPSMRVSRNDGVGSRFRYSWALNSDCFCSAAPMSQTMADTTGSKKGNQKGCRFVLAFLGAPHIITT